MGEGDYPHHLRLRDCYLACGSRGNRNAHVEYSDTDLAPQEDHMALEAILRAMPVEMMASLCCHEGSLRCDQVELYGMASTTSGNPRRRNY
uniref:Uncharacterized protein n=1 Tax=Oryza barthii TaxID=65489 RepID=A0A0D3F588_9ORYZ